MVLGRVIGNVVCTIKHPGLNGCKLLIVQPIDRQGRDKGRAIVALDAVLEVFDEDFGVVILAKLVSRQRGQRAGVSLQLLAVRPKIFGRLQRLWPGDAVAGEKDRIRMKHPRLHVVIGLLFHHLLA